MLECRTRRATRVFLPPQRLDGLAPSRSHGDVQRLGATDLQFLDLHGNRAHGLRVIKDQDQPLFSRLGGDSAPAPGSATLIEDMVDRRVCCL
jgi:hypothetical protein